MNTESTLFRENFNLENEMSFEDMITDFLNNNLFIFGFDVINDSFKALMISTNRLSMLWKKACAKFIPAMQAALLRSSGDRK